MDQTVKKAFHRAVKKEPFPKALNMELVELDDGYSAVEMVFDPGSMGNIFNMAHGGAIFALIDEAFETASNSHGTVAVALNVNITYIASPQPGSRLRAEAREVSLTRRTATYDIKVEDEKGKLMATCQALCYRKRDKVPFL
ncbi:MAG: PaaI family thioesterase [Deltaproteobacteria bacterium]|nr:PaaI family thioesterase [Deltaproteobacteria bacterium]MBW2051554.1 PaaI family thioesterase [Deltaproteobacteria bacterium]MBW2142520.1 PaaI family thioesterase [Deltaproteobacteria bacterium]